MKVESKEERTPEAAAAAAPVSLPAGSFDVEALKNGLDAAALEGNEKRADDVAKAVADANKSAHEAVDPALVPGNRYEEVTREDLGITERIQVYDGKPEEEGEKAAPPPPPPPPPPPATGKGKGGLDENTGDDGAGKEE